MDRLNGPSMAIPRLHAAKQYPMSHAQRRLFFLHKLDPQNCAYNLPDFFEVEGQLDIGLLHRAFTALMERHTSLRTTFHLQDGEAVQRVEESFHLPMVMIDFSGLVEAEQQEKLATWVQKELQTPFDLTTGPVFRIGVAKKRPNCHVLHINMHQIIGDAWSKANVMREFYTFYTAFRDGQEAGLSALTIQYTDYAHWQNERVKKGAFAEAEAYWMQQLADAWPLPELPLDHADSPVYQAKGRSETLRFDARLCERIQQFCLQSDTTLYMVLLATTSVFLHRMSGGDDVVIGTPVAGRGRAELEAVIGCFAKTLPLRIDVSGNPSFGELLERVKKTARDVYVHQEYPVDLMVDRLHPLRDQSRSALPAVIFSVNDCASLSTPTGLQVQKLPLDVGNVAFDLGISFAERDGGIECRFEYWVDLYETETIRRWLLQMETLLRSLLANPFGNVCFQQLVKSGEMSSNQV